MCHFAGRGQVSAVSGAGETRNSYEQSDNDFIANKALKRILISKSNSNQYNKDLEENQTINSLLSLVEVANAEISVMAAFYHIQKQNAATFTSNRTNL